MRYLYPAVFAIMFLSPGIKAQDDDQQEMPEVLSLSVKSLNFIRNNEYFNPIGGSGFHLSGEVPLHAEKSLWIEGYTLTGFFFRPEVVYRPAEKITLRAGGHFLKYWGTGGFSQARPVFSTSVSLSARTTLTLGSLDGSDKHRMFDPHFDKERFYTHYAEDGFQIRTVTDNIFNDAWISWENFIFKGDNEREIFTFGESFRYKTPLFLDFFEAELPVQMQFRHYGGQISDYPERVTTFVNLAAGARLNFDAGKGGRIGLEYTGFLNSVIPDRETYTISRGNASWWRLHYDFRRYYFGASWWHADNFYAPNGNGLFASIYVFDSDYVVHERKLLTGAARISLFPEDYLELFFGIETYYDLCEERLDHAITLHLDFGKLFRLR